MSSVDYPYESRDAKCRFNISKSILLSDLKLSSYASLSSDNENLWLDALYTIGPIAVGMNADLDSFFSYGSGIFFDEKCDETSLNHAVLLVGYGTDDTYGGYWIVKNTWGELKLDMKSYLEAQAQFNLQQDPLGVKADTSESKEIIAALEVMPFTQSSVIAQLKFHLLKRIKKSSNFC